MTFFEEWLPLKPYLYKMIMLDRRNENKKKTVEEAVEVRIKYGLNTKPANKISSHNYSLLGFFPKFLFNQFKQFANLLFLILTIIQIVPSLSPFGYQSTLCPLLFIIGCSAIREIFEDVCRRVRDRRVNHQLVLAYHDNSWQLFRWDKIYPGQLLKIANNEQIPADMLVFSVGKPSGVAYIETANLDGETNLKVRQATQPTMNLTTQEEIFNFWSGEAEIVCEGPNKSLDSFSGYLEYVYKSVGQTTQTGKPVRYPLGPGNLFLRGARLKNTEFIYGVVIYAGKDTKLMKNNNKREIKRSQTTRLTNSIMCTQFGMCLLLALLAAVVQRCFPPRKFLLTTFQEDQHNSLMFTYLGCVVLFNGFVPISLYVTVEVVQVFQGLFINSDSEMTDSKGRCADVKGFSLNSELGQVTYVMTDKTGTLTQNKMVFRQCSVGQVKYANKKDCAERVFSASKMISHMKSNERHNATELDHFFLACSACHSVTPDMTSSRPEGEIPIYHATSPDEHALVNFAAQSGYVFMSREGSSFEVSRLKEKKSFELLALLEFNSDRKRMSVIIKDQKGKIILYTKGADFVIFQRLQSGSDESMKKTRSHLKGFANRGYRTLCFGYRYISDEEFEGWDQKYKSACVALDGRRKAMDDVAELIEKDLKFIGVSAIEDRLQDGVPETIEKMITSGMHVWVLTGDKLETAVNIGNSCKLLGPKIPMLVLACNTVEQVKTELYYYIDSLGEVRLRERNQKLGLVVDATSLDILLEPSIQFDFTRLALCCSTVICCRCTPIQKALVTRLVRASVNGTTLAVGDGANDVAMIQEADVGIGIAGEEGMQASCIADYSITQFKHLNRLLFVHGTLSVFRTSKCILFSLYKNVMETCTLYFFTLMNGHSDQPVADQWTVVRFNMFFTSFTALFMGLFDRPIAIERFHLHPYLYNVYQNQLTNSNQLLWFFSGLGHALFISFSIFLNWHHGAPLSNDNGRDMPLWVFGIMTYTCLVLVSNLQAIISTNSITVFGFAGFAISAGLFVCSLVWDSYLWEFIPGHSIALATIVEQLPYLRIMLVCGWVSVSCFFPEMLRIVIRRSFFNAPEDDLLRRDNMNKPSVVLTKMYQPIVKFCDLVGLKTPYIDGGRYGFAFAQDDGQFISQKELIKKTGSKQESSASAVTNTSPSKILSRSTNNGSVEDKTVES